MFKLCIKVNYFLLILEKPPIPFSKTPYLNDLSQWLFDKILWPKQLLFIFSNEEDAITCLNLIFPTSYDKDTDAGKVRIKVLIVTDAEKNAGLISERFINKGLDDFDCKETVLSDLGEDWVKNSVSNWLCDSESSTEGNIEINDSLKVEVWCSTWTHVLIGVTGFFFGGEVKLDP